MSTDQYTAAGDSPGNEELAMQMQNGDRQAAGLLISRNEGWLTNLALKHAARCDLEDLKQEGALALLEAAERFDPSLGTKLLTYAAPAVISAMADYGARASLPLSIPPSRYRQLRRAAYICSGLQDDAEPALIDAVCKELDVAPKTAAELLRDYRNLFHVRQLDGEVFSVSRGGDPAKAYDRQMRQTLLHQLMEEVLKPRELNLIRCYLGIGMPDEKGMTFQELAVRLNYNGPSGAEKAYKSALRKLRKELPSGAYGRWISAQAAIRRAKAEAGSGGYATPQSTWLTEKELAERFVCEAASLIRVHEIFSGALEGEGK